MPIPIIAQRLRVILELDLALYKFFLYILYFILIVFDTDYSSFLLLFN